MKKLFFLLAAMLVCCSLFAKDFNDYGKLQLVNNQLCDKGGNPVQLRGVCAKCYYEWQYFCTNKESWPMMKQLGANVVSFNVLYSYTDMVSTTDLIKDAIDWCHKNGLYLLVNWNYRAHFSSVEYSSFHNDRMLEIINMFGNLSEFCKMKGYDNVLYNIGHDFGEVSWSSIKQYADLILPAIQTNRPGAVVIVGTPNDNKDICSVIADPIDPASYPNLNIMYDFTYYTEDTISLLDTLNIDTISLLDTLNIAAGSLPIFVSEWHFGDIDSRGDGLAGNFVDETAKADLFRETCYKNSGNQLISWCGNVWSEKQHSYVDNIWATGAKNNNYQDFYLSDVGRYMKNVLVIDPIVKYGLYVKGEQVTLFNCDDILGDGTMSYNDDTKTLTLNNANITYEEEHILSIHQDLVINCVGTNTFIATGANNGIEEFGGDVTIAGSGSLSINSDDGAAIYTQNDLTIQGGCVVTVQTDNQYAIELSGGTLTVDGATLIAKGNGTNPTIIECDELIMLNGVSIRTAHTYDATTHQFLNAAGNEAKDDIIIGVAGTGLEGLTIDNAQCTIKKMIIDNHLYIRRDNNLYTATGARVK